LLAFLDIIAYSIIRIKEKHEARERERQVAMDAQKQIDTEVTEYYASQRAREREEHAARLEHKRLLDKVLRDKREEEERRRERERAEDEESEAFAAAKRVSK
jgi:predicted metal-dependent peptidase